MRNGLAEAGDSPQKRGQYSLKLPDLLPERGYDNKKVRSLQKFVFRILQVGDDKIDVMEEGMESGRKPGQEEERLHFAHSMPDDGFSPEAISEIYGPQ